MSGITFGSNINALRAARRVSEAGTASALSFERLASGQRLSHASGDVAGLAIADSLRAMSRVYSQGVRNLSDGISILHVADSAIDQLGAIIVRLTELATQAVNGTYSSRQREALDAEAQALIKEFSRIEEATEFNGLKLLSEDVLRVALQGGIGEHAVLAIRIGGGLATEILQTTPAHTAIGTGTFQEATSYDTESFSSFSLALGDLNGDGVLDLVTTGYALGVGGYATVRLGMGDGSFGTATSFATGGAATLSATLGDLNGDGVLDLVTTGATNLLNGDGYAYVQLGLGDGSFGAAVSYAAESRRSWSIKLGDVNGDGKLDLVTAGDADVNDGYATVRFGTGDGSFGTPTSYLAESHSTSSVILGDLDGDGLLDLVTAGQSASYEGYVTVRLGIGGGTFGAAASYATESSTSASVSLGDLNGDGVLDLVTAGVAVGNDGYATVRLGVGDGTFGTGTSYATESYASVAVKLGDLNGDGVLDLITAGQTDGSDGYATVRFGIGDGSFGTATSYATEDGRSYSVALGDLNGDGVLDLVTAGQTDGFGGYATVRLAFTQEGPPAVAVSLSLKTPSEAQAALNALSRTSERLTTQRGEIGAFQSVIAVALNVLQTSSDNFKAAESRIRDSDVADELARLLRFTILQQVATSLLAQANQEPALVLQLLSSR